MERLAIPRMKSVVVTGLDYSMKPELVRFESMKGYIKPFPEIKVMHLIKSLAVMIYNQEKLTPYYHKNVCDGRNTLAYFICAMHRQSAPQPITNTHSRQHSASSDVSGSSKASRSSKSSCPLEIPGKQCDLPKLSTTSMLPLGYWDSLYYALVAEIRLLREDLEQRFGFACENGNPVLHEQGADGFTNHTVTAIDLAVTLENAWYALMDNRLVATLDDAVRMRNLRERAARKEVDSATRQSLGDADTARPGDDNDTEHEKEEDSIWPPIVPGLIDVNALKPETIIAQLWTKHAPEINRVCLEDYEDESMLTAYRAELHAKEVEAAVAAGSPLPSASFCACHRTCMCKIRCDQDSQHCTCMNGRAQIYHLVYKQESKKDKVHAEYVKADRNVPNQFLGAATNTLAQMQVAAVANEDPIIVQACRIIHDANNTQELHIAKQLRERSNTNDSHLAYVPPNRSIKDIHPLGFYRDYCPQRYPKMSRPDPEPGLIQPYGAPGTSLNHAGVPARKLVPGPISTARHPHDGIMPQPREYNYGPTPPSSSPYDDSIFNYAGQMFDASNPGSPEQSPLTQRFPTKDTNKATPAVASASFAGQTALSADHFDPADKYVGLLSRHPSTLEREEQASDSFPSLYRQPLFGMPTKPASTNNLPNLGTLKVLSDRPQPALPQPDFVNPRPALKQRYVSAGGNAKLSERPEIPPPNLISLSSIGGNITKDEQIAKMHDPEFVSRSFGEAARGLTGSLSTPRGSAESESNGGRKSDDCDHHDGDGGGGEKRDRTSSSGSRRLAKLKRVFSSKGSGQDEGE